MTSLHINQKKASHDISDQESTTVPDQFVCPLTLDVMQRPLYSKHGHSFERKAILEWLATEDTCPITRRPLSPSLLIPNNQLARQISNWKRQNVAERTNYTINLVLSLGDEANLQ